MANGVLTWKVLFRLGDVAGHGAKKSFGEFEQPTPLFLCSAYSRTMNSVFSPR